MTVTETIPVTGLPVAVRKIIPHIVTGLTNSHIATTEHISPSTVTGYVGILRQRLHCPARCSREIFVHLLLTHLPDCVPAVPEAATDFQADDADRRLIHALTEHNTTAGIAHALGTTPAELSKRITDLRYRMGAADRLGIIVLAHSLKILGTSATEASSVPRDPAAAGPQDGAS
ncbi:hypothetical protein ACFYNX_26990 [Streptomyces sp. NPDC007872]|uniref:hypothetical protein n=1 Tax=Streptomyces sp. NPDC007872 TaxID=3364782 RepID=UPI0036905332